MWVGWNSKFDQSAKSTQNIWYLPQINESPTSHAVVAETLKRAIQVADECGKTQIASTYDLAIAKMALQIQKAESPLYDRVFVNLGAFHVELAFFCAVGKYIAESGGPFILSESGVLQSGSLKGFINGKAYNRCKRLHQFLVDDLLIEKKESLPLPLKENLSKEVLEVLQSYEDYRNDTLKGKHGKRQNFGLVTLKWLICTTPSLGVFGREIFISSFIAYQKLQTISSLSTISTTPVG